MNELGFKSWFKLKLLSRLHNYPADHWKRLHCNIFELSVLPTRNKYIVRQNKLVWICLLIVKYFDNKCINVEHMYFIMIGLALTHFVEQRILPLLPNMKLLPLFLQALCVSVSLFESRFSFLYCGAFHLWCCVRR